MSDELIPVPMILRSHLREKKARPDAFSDHQAVIPGPDLTQVRHTGQGGKERDLDGHGIEFFRAKPGKPGVVESSFPG